jgi:gas vesicle protein GvpA/GvpJ/GvpM family
MKPRRTKSGLQKVLDGADPTLLDLVDHALSKGVVIDGEVILGLADVDLVYLRLSAILCAADQVTKPRGSRPRRRLSS